MSDRPTRTEISAIDSSIDADFGTVYETGEGLSTTIIASVYDNTATYEVGDYVIESKKLYKCITAVTEPEEFNSEKWEITKVGNEIEELSGEVQDALTDKMDKVNPTGSGSLSIGRKANTTISLHSIALGNNVTASAVAAFAEGSGTIASASEAHAEGQNTEAKGQHSHAEGSITVAQGIDSHAEGVGSLARGVASHAEGDGTTAKGDYSHAEGHFTTAKHRAQHVFGEYNIIDSSEAEPTERGTYVEIVGNGDSGTNERSNARTLDWDGNEVLAGDLTINGSTSVTTALGSKADASNVYTKTEVNTALSNKANANDVYTKNQVDTALNSKADSDSVYTKTEVDNKIAELPEAMIFKGTLGIGGTVESLPTASASNEGWMFKCITAGTYAGLTLKVGDTVTCFNPPNTSIYEWDKTGSQDTDTDTWRAIKVNGTEKLGNGISSGDVDFVDTTNIKMSFDGNTNAIKATLDGVYTSTQADQKFPTKNDIEDTTIAGALYHLGFYLDENGGLCQVNSI